ncbi:MAG: polyprenyl synthetase family protein [Verrucomicrobiota bacterium]|nr:polyprenyl synthetase family protein [Verrucomicrobiota bacterium]
MFDLNAYMQARTRLADTKLDELLPNADEPPQALHQAMRYSIFPGGKRIRPVLCMAAAEAVGAPPEAAILPAVAVEIFHTYTLIHDDLPCMDNDDVRRGRPAVHKVYGEANALLAGDAMQALAFELAASCPVPTEYSEGAFVLELAGIAGSRGVVGGQVEDLIAAATTPSADTIEFIHRHKTADLFVASARLGAMAGNADSEQLDALTEYALNLGLAFQITDDLLDAAADADCGSKRPASILMVCDAAAARAKAEAHIARACAAPAAFPEAQAAPLFAIARLILDRAQ